MSPGQSETSVTLSEIVPQADEISGSLMGEVLWNVHVNFRNRGEALDYYCHIIHGVTSPLGVITCVSITKSLLMSCFLTLCHIFIFMLFSH